MKNFKAFSILETSISLSIFGLIFSCFFTIYMLISANQNQIINEQKFFYIRKSMESYLLRYAKLPCASDNESGIEKKECYAGLIPYRTLGIDKSYMYDSNKKPFKYVVNKLFTNTNLPICTPLCYKPHPNEKSFLRLYKYTQNTLIYDDISSNKLEIIEGNTNIIEPNDYFFVMSPVYYPFKNLLSLEKWVNENNQNNNDLKINNLVAWLIISFGKHENCKEHKENKKNNEKFYKSSEDPKFCDKIFFQSRFDMAAQIGFPETAEPIYDEENKSKK